MWKWIIRVIVVSTIAFFGYGVYDFYRGGFHNRPNMPPGAFSLSFKNGLRGILVDVPNEKETRRYFGFPVDVAPYLVEAWSFCTPPSAEERDQITVNMDSRNWPGERLEAACKIEVDEEIVIRGYVTSVPKL